MTNRFDEALDTALSESASRLEAFSEELETSLDKLTKASSRQIDSLERLTSRQLDQSIGRIFGRLGTLGEILKPLSKPISKGLSSVLGQTAGSLGGTLGGALGSIFGGARAIGGPVNPGQAFLVGERGPELFVPGQTGFIQPNNALGSPAVNVNVTIQTPSPESFLQSRTQVQAALASAVRQGVRKQ